MKKVISVLLASLFLCSFFAVSSFAATAAADKPGPLGFGVLNGGVPTVRYYFNNNMAGEVGFSLANVASTTQLQLSGALTNDFISDQKVKVHWGGMLTYTSNVAAANTTTINIAGILGAEAFIFPSLSLTIDIIPIAYTNVNANGNQSSVFQIGSATSTIFSSFHYYL
jgi:hypothetical protein